MPSDVYNELKQKGSYTLSDNTILIGNSKDNPTLRLDFTYTDNKPVQYVNKEYEFVDNMNEQPIDEDRVISLIQLFVKTVLKEDVTLQKVDNPSHYSGNNYLTFEDQNKNIYVVQLDKNMVVNYTSSQSLIH